MKKLISFFLCLIMITGIISVSTVTGFAEVEMMGDDDFSFVLNSDNTFSLYRYYGTDTDITLPSKAFGGKVTAVYERAFDESNLTSVTIPEGYVTIGENAFNDCDGLTTVKIPNGLKTIGVSAFGDCSSLTSVDFSEANSLNEISAFAFNGDSLLTSVSIPENVRIIGYGAFSRTALTSVRIPAGVTELNGTFNDCESLAGVNLPETLTVIGENTFNGCTLLTSVALPDSVTEIGDCAFMDCSGYNTEKLPKNLQSIGNSAFKNCTSLTVTELPVNLKRIGESAFENDTAMTELFIPDSVTAIGGYAFYPMGVQRKPYPDDNESKITITCYKDSYAADYCYENFIWQNENQHAVDKVIGDVDLDGVLIIVDATIIQKYQIGKAEIPTYRAQDLADVNRDGKISVRDATLIQMYLANMIDSFDEEEV